MRIGQLLGNLLRLFRAELYARGDAQDGFEGIRPAHLQVFGSIKAGGSRLTTLAASAGVSLSSMAELVDDLEALGYATRRPDPADGRAKLVSLTDKGWDAIVRGRRIIEEIERDWSGRLDGDRFEILCRSLQALLEELDPKVVAEYATPDSVPNVSRRRR